MPVVGVLGTVLLIAVTLAGVPAPVAAHAPNDSAAAPPLAVPPVAGEVIMPFEPPATRYGAGHRGVDLAAEPGEPVVSALPGLVAFAGPVAGVGWVSVDHGGGLRTTYGPLDPRAVDAGTRVRAGDLLGFVAASASHLDWGAKLDGEYIDPLGLLGRWEVALVGNDAPVILGDYLDLVAQGPITQGPVVSATGQATLLRLPVAGRPSSGFGLRRHPISGEVETHAGLDLAAPAGTPVRAAASGVIRSAGWSGGYGLLVEIDHGGGLATRYAHLSVITVAAGDHVAAGQRIGAVGSTGLSTGAHLHLEVRVDGRATDPLDWL